MPAVITNADGFTLKAKNLQIQQGNKILLSDVNLTLTQGTAICISGKIGTGKTSLLDVLGLLHPPKAGEIYIGSSYNCVLLSRGERDVMIGLYFAYVFQTPKLLLRWNALENVSLPLMVKGYSKAERQQKAEEYCQKLGIPDEYLTRNVSKLSAGTMKLVSIARAFAKEPKILIADEPTANLDKNTRNHITKLLVNQAKKKQVTLIVSTHLQTTKGADFDERYVIKDQQLVREE